MSEIDLESEAVKEAIKAAVDDAVTGLKNKNKELLDKLQKAKKESTIDPDDYNRLMSERDALEEKLSESSKAFKQLQSESDKVKKSYESESGFVQKLLIDNGLTNALSESGVKDPVLLKAAKSMLLSQAQIKIDGENRFAMIGDKSVNDFIAEWSKTDEGKYFVAAPQNSGGGASGGTSNSNSNVPLTSAQKIAAGLKEIYK